MKPTWHEFLFLAFIFSFLFFLEGGSSRENLALNAERFAFVESVSYSEEYFLNPNTHISGDNGNPQTDIITEKPSDDFISDLREHIADPRKDIVASKKVAGLSYKIRKGETLSSIAQKFRVAMSSILEANYLRDAGLIKAGEMILIPGAVKTLIARANYIPAPAYVSAKAAIGSGLFAPISGFNWGKLHPTNAVDIANECGTPVYAAHAGAVTMALIGWNGGGGNTVEVTSPRGFSTRYGHMDTIYAQEGAQVTAGDLIGLVGNTGKTIGYTGCHVHFETRGIENPLIR